MMSFLLQVKIPIPSSKTRKLEKTTHSSITVHIQGVYILQQTYTTEQNELEWKAEKLINTLGA